MTILYNIGIHFFILFLRLAALLGHDKARRAVKGRVNVFERLQKEFSENDSPVVWFHASSLGEYELGRPLIEAFSRDKNYKVLISFFSPSGYENFQSKEDNQFLTYLPFDTRSNSRRFIQQINPEKVFFLKNDLWFNYLNELNRRAVNTYVVSGLFKPKQFFFKFRWKRFEEVLKNLTHIFLVNESSHKFLRTKGFSNITLAGDLRMDRVLAIKSEGVRLEEIEYFKSTQPMILLGSSWEKEEELIAEFLKVQPNTCRVIIAPHEIGKKRIDSLKERFPNAALFSNFKNGSEASDILIIDQIGLLKYIYCYADIAIIGGAWGRGLHNCLEAAVFNLPLLFGPRIQSFQEALDLVELQGAMSISNQDEFNAELLELLNNEKKRMEMGINAGNYVSQSKGAVDRILKAL
ncbi:MAG: glycosyltransferase N-terminal domain-containing protein [Bacteroidota bacterium]